VCYDRDERERQWAESVRRASRNKERKNGGAEKQDDAEAANQAAHLTGNVKVCRDKREAHGRENMADALRGEPANREPEMLWNGHGVFSGLTTPSSVTRPAGDVDGNQGAPAGVVAAHG
jgi:hypothetical protein